MCWTASDMSSGILRSPSGLVGPISGGLGYSAVFIQLGLHCNIIFNWIHCLDCHKCFWQHLTCLQACWDSPQTSSGIYQADSNILQYLDYIEMKYLTKLIIQTVVNVLDSIWHVFGHPAVPLGCPQAYIGWIRIFYSIYSTEITLQCNI
jgi:hypothetical protein